MKFKKVFSANYFNTERNRNSIKFIILHYTGMQSERASIKKLTSIKSNVSAHYLINRKGAVTKMIDEKKTAWHAGKSKWKNFTNLNKDSIGIEIVNKGHKFGYEKFTKLQISKIIFICKILMKKYKIKKDNILAHSDIAPLRKQDPGEKFPWLFLSKKGIGSWYRIKKKIKEKNLEKKNFRNYFFNNLHKIGYRYFDRKRKLSSDYKIIKAFQRRYRQNKINGLIDQECIAISANLAKNTHN